MHTNMLVLLIAMIALPTAIYSQRTDPAVYELNLWIDLPLTAGGLYAAGLGLEAQEETPRFTVQELNALNPDRIPWFDRSYLSVDPTRERSFSTFQMPY